MVEGLPADSSSLEELLSRAEDHVRLAGCMRTLGEVQRAVVTLPKVTLREQVAGGKEKRAEWERYQKAVEDTGTTDVTPWEIEYYLPFF